MLHGSDPSCLLGWFGNDILLNLLLQNNSKLPAVFVHFALVSYYILVRFDLQMGLK